MSFLRNIPKNQLKQRILCVCFCRCVWQNSNHMTIGIKYQPSSYRYRKLHHTSYLAKKISDHYKVLGVSRRATAQEIKDAYYELSKRYHPDKNKSSSDVTSERFREIKEAYEVLGNHGKKRKYDKVSPSSGAFSQQASTKRTGNEIVVQDTDAYARYVARFSTPIDDNPTAQAIDKSLNDRTSEIFRENQKWRAESSDLNDDQEIERKSSKNFKIFFGICFLIAAFARFIHQSNEKRYEKMLREYKEKKSK